MLSEMDRLSLALSLDVSSSIHRNDCELARSIVKTINDLTPDKFNSNPVIDAIRAETTVENPLNSDEDAYAIIVEGLNVITNKPYFLRIRKLGLALANQDMVELQAAIDQVMTEGLKIDPMENDVIYVGLLVRACSIVRDYDAMDKLRKELGDHHGL